MLYCYWYENAVLWITLFYCFLRNVWHVMFVLVQCVQWLFYYCCFLVNDSKQYLKVILHLISLLDVGDLFFSYSQSQ